MAYVPKPHLTLCRGIPGSGKSTLAKVLVASGYAQLHFEADQFFTDKDGNYNWDGNKIEEAHNWCLTETMRALEAGLRVVVSNTFTREREMSMYIDFCRKYGIPFTSIIVENRHGHNSVNGVPKATLDKMVERFSVKLV